MIFLSFVWDVGRSLFFYSHLSTTADHVEGKITIRALLMLILLDYSAINAQTRETTSLHST